jgi:predicted small lipoprotein YifL
MAGLGLRAVAAWSVLLTGLAACGDDGPTNRPPDDETTSASTTPFTTSPSTSLSSSATTDDGTDSDASESDSGDGDTTSTTGDDPEFCPTRSHRCIADVPEGWEGPGTFVAADAAAQRPACNAPYPEASVFGLTDLDAPPATCACECGDPNGALCESSTTLRYWGSAAECSEGASTQVSVFAGVCINLPSPFPGDSYWQIDVLEASGGACARDEEEIVADAVWQTQVLTCWGGELRGGCATGRVCAPRPEAEDAPLCVWRLGEHDCPEGYDAQTMLYTDFNDTRGCEPCTCGDPVGVCDEARVLLTENFNCNVPFANNFDADGECHAGSGIAVRAALLNTGAPNAFCTPSDPAPVGEAIGADPITVCCVGP